MTQFGWTEETIAEAKRLWALDHSASAIATALGAPSRNAVVGKLYRLGFKKLKKGFGASAAGGTPKAARASAAARSVGARKPKVTLSSLFEIPAGSHIDQDASAISLIAPSPPVIGEGLEGEPGQTPRSRPKPISVASDMGPYSPPVHIMNLRDWHCRRPTWGNVKANFDDLFFCGIPAAENSPYCPSCRDRLTQRVQVERAA